MNRFHVHVRVADVEKAIPFYAALFGSSPAVVKSDYAKWMLDDPRVNFAISARGRTAGVDHVGIQVESPGELAELAGRLKAAGTQTFDEQATTCCYAKSDKSWVADPAGVVRAAYRHFGLPLDGVEAAVRAWLDDPGNRGDRFGQWTYDLADHEIRADEVRACFGRYRERFAV